MDNGLFRKKSLDHISSPEQLHDYMRVTSPRLWMILAAIVILLGGFIIYAATTRMESTEVFPMQVGIANYITGYIPAERQDIVKVGMPVRIAGKSGKISYLDNSIRYRLNVFLESDAPMDYRSYWISLGEESDIPLLVGDEFNNALKNVQYDGSGYTIPIDSDPEMIRKFANGDVRVRFWTMEFPEEGGALLKGGRLATVSGYDTITSVQATVVLDDQSEIIPEGTYAAEIVTENTTPISFLWN